MYKRQSIASQLNQEGVPPPSVYAGIPLKNGRFAGLWSSERISEMLQNETYIGNMVQGRQVKINYKSKKCLKQPPESWVVVENTHEPLVDRETFRQVRLLVNSRKYTRSRTYDYLLKGMVYCHECGALMTVANRKTTKGEDRLFFICKTYQRFTKAGLCTCHTIKVDTVTEAVVSKVREVCQSYLDQDKLLVLAKDALAKNAQKNKVEIQLAELQKKIDLLTSNLDRMYTDRLNGLLPEEDFQRIFNRTKSERQQLELQQADLRSLQKNPVNSSDKAKELVQRFVESACASRELLVSLVDRIELTQDKQLIIRFRIPELQDFSL